MSSPDITSAYKETVAAQRVVATPANSAWVAANAGSGKTKVLTDRVMRLLLAGTDPSKILCITFTKAAAAEMADRLFRRLGEWALMEDDALQDQLAELDGEAARDRDQLSVARQLFARALETPGGLKIQTIHSFCESVLKRFPLEAGVMPGARVIEEHEARQLLQEIVSAAGVRAFSGEAQDKQDFVTLTKEIDEENLRKDLFTLANRSFEILQCLEKHGGLDGFLDHLARRLGADPRVSSDAHKTAFVEKLDMTWLEGAYSAYLDSGKDDQKRAAALRLVLDVRTAEDAYEAACTFFMTEAGTPRKKMADAGAEKALPGLAERMTGYQAALVEALDHIRSRELYDTSAACYRLALRISEDYTRQKRARGWLDFDDLIQKTAQLFETAGADWVLYKLDQGIDHVLVDEAQDTSGPQWQVINGPLNEFFAGEAARELARTIFVVGDEKQSIYSFQGADVGLFRTQQEALTAQVTAAEMPFMVRGLTLSFRSVSPVLRFVDEVFADREAAEGVSETTELVHSANRQGHAGLVELWPLIEKEQVPAGRPWDVPVDTVTANDPSRQLAAHIADRIRHWLKTEELLPSRGRPIRPGDVMILCQRRGPVFHELVRELTRQGVPTAGTDRIRLLDHMAVKDMLSALRFALQPADNLSLAEVLKGPLFGFSEEDLFLLAYDRGAATLWQRLCAVADDQEGDEFTEKCRTAAASLREARSRGLFAGAHAFMTFLLEEGDPSGWRRFYSRLGMAAREPLQELLNEALDFENSQPRTVQGFLSHIERRETELKKEVDGGDDLVRIITVHGSKGLEADIVILADAAYDNFSKVGNFLPLGEAGVTSAGYAPEEGLYVRSTGKAADNQAARAARDYAVAQRAEEYRRLFYVAATRARDRLYICGVLGGRTKPETLLGKPPAEASWYALARNAFSRLQEKGVVTEHETTPWDGQTLRFETEQKAEADAQDATPAAAAPPLPGWLQEAAPEETAVKRLSPSHVALELEKDNPLTPDPAGTVFQPVDPDQETSREKGEVLGPYARGNMLHLLLEKLPDTAQEKRAEYGRLLIDRHHPDLPDSIKQEWLAEVTAVLDDPAFRHVFGPGSRAEVPLVGVPKGARDNVLISGQIDRLCVTDGKVLIVDFKTNRPPPDEVEDVPAAYVTQLAAYRALLQEIYPDHEISCALLWTWVAKLMIVPAARLDHAFVQHIAGKPAAEKG